MTDYQELKRLAEVAWQERDEDGTRWPIEGDWFDCQSGPEFEYLCAADPATVLALIADLHDYQQGAKAEAEAGDEARAEVRRLKSEVEALQLRASSDMQNLLPGLSDALEDLEIHGRHSDQGYRKLQDWYRKMETAHRVISAPMFGADHADLVSQNTWLRKMVGHQAEQHAPMEPIDDPEGWSRRIPGYDLPALLKDAERYRWLRKTESWEDAMMGIRDLWIVSSREEVANTDGEYLDAAIDAAMSKESANGQAT